MNYEKNLRQTATYWAQTGLDGYGKPTFAAPVALPCRWEDRTEVLIDKRGTEFTSKARVFFGSQIDLEGYLFKGTTLTADPRTVTDAWEIRGGKVTPDLRAIKNLYVYFL